MMIHGIAPQFLVDDFDRSVDYYCRCLGFQLDFSYDGFYGSVSRDGCAIHIKCAPKTAADREHRKRHNHLDAYIAVTNATALHDAFAFSGATIARGLETQPWQCLDFYVEDPDGYILCFSQALPAQPDRPDPALFESAVDAIVSGDEATLRGLLACHPDLARARSTRDHRSTLLHYVSANGVEDVRQVTPKNIVAITELLIAAGADVNATSEAYGGGSTPLGLTATSLHPAEAGVQIALLRLLLRHGATMEGGQGGNGHGLVLACLANGQPTAARFFADRGARLNVIEAAGIGALDRVRAFLDDAEDGLVLFTPGELDSALQYAAGYGHAAVAAFLLDHGANPAMSDDAGQTPLHWATFGPHADVTRALLAKGAPVNARDRRFEATPLDWMVHAWATATETDARARGCEVVALLVSAGAVPDLERFGPDVQARVRADAAMMDALGLTISWMEG